MSEISSSGGTEVWLAPTDGLSSVEKEMLADLDMDDGFSNAFGSPEEIEEALRRNEKIAEENVFVIPEDDTYVSNSIPCPDLGQDKPTITIPDETLKEISDFTQKYTGDEGPGIDTYGNEKARLEREVELWRSRYRSLLQVLNTFGSN